MLSLVLSTIAFFVASYYLKRYLDDMDIPKGMTRSADDLARGHPKILLLLTILLPPHAHAR